MLTRILPIIPPHRRRQALAPLSAMWLALSFLSAILLQARPASASIHENIPAATVTSAPPAVGKGGALPAFIALSFDAPSPTEMRPLRSQFTAEYPKHAPGAGSESPSFVLQRTEYGGSRYGLFAEMGDIRVRQTLNTVQEAAGRGGRFGFLTGSSGNSAKFETFAASGTQGGSRDDMLVGAAGELSLQESIRFKTIVLSSRQSLDAEGRWPDAGERKGDVVGFLAVVDPFKGRLAAEAEFDYSVFDGNTSDDAAAQRDSACRVKLGGGWGSSRYSALYERTGPQYRLMANRAPAKDTEGISLGMATAFELHAFDVKLSRYNDNTDKNELYPRLYRYEGFVDYRFKGFKAVPLALQYKKTFIDTSNEPLGYLPKEVEEEAVSGQMNYLMGKWDLGLRGALSQRVNKLSQQRETATHTVGFLPRFAAGAVTVAPDLSVRRVTNFSSNLRTDHYTLDLGLNGSLRKKLEYEVKGGIRRETTGIPGTGKQVVGAKLKAAYPLARFFNWTSVPSVGIKGEYKGIANRTLDRRDNDFSLLISLDGVKFM